jgi:hypothetical protein
MLVRFLALTAGAMAAGAAQADDDGAGESPTAKQALHPSARGHGSFSIGYQNTSVDGLRATDGRVLDVGTGTMRSVQFDLDYFVSDAWSLHVGIPYVSNVFHGSPHCPTTQPPQCQNVRPIDPQHPESHFQDDGHYHGTWQDWTVGAAWHATVRGNYLITPSLTYYFPSHDYVFFSNAAAGQRIWKVEPSIELAHQFDFSNVYYRARYSYVVTEKVLDTRMNYHRLELELGYFLNDHFTLRGFAIGKKGDGYSVTELGALSAGATNDYWYHHDQILKHDFAEYGIGADYHLGGRYTLSAALHRLIWGQSVINFRHAVEVRLTRDF